MIFILILTNRQRGFLEIPSYAWNLERLSVFRILTASASLSNACYLPPAKGSKSINKMADAEREQMTFLKQLVENKTNIENEIRSFQEVLRSVRTFYICFNNLGKVFIWTGFLFIANAFSPHSHTFNNFFFFVAKCWDGWYIGWQRWVSKIWHWCSRCENCKK